MAVMSEEFEAALVKIKGQISNLQLAAEVSS